MTQNRFTQRGQWTSYYTAASYNEMEYDNFGFPDGGTFFGTSGCIGLTGAKSELERFYNTLS
jgi:hypothetical protein